MQPWPYGMPSSINPFVVFLGPSPGNSPPADWVTRGGCQAYSLPCAGNPHPNLYVSDTKKYWVRVRQLGSHIIQARAVGISESDSHALIGQLNLGTGHFGEAKNAPFESEYCRWVPDAILDYLRPSYVVLLGMRSRLGRTGSGFDPMNRLEINWAKPDDCFSFAACKVSKFVFRIWNRKRPDGKLIRVVMWPQHPRRPPMTKDQMWLEAAREFIFHAHN
jgi:hypothetical protein